jgi:hypothetical protein
MAEVTDTIQHLPDRVYAPRIFFLPRRPVCLIRNKMVPSIAGITYFSQLYGYNILVESINRNYIGLLDSGDQVYRPHIIILYNGAILAGDVHRVTLFRRLSVAYCMVSLSTPLVNFLADELIVQSSPTLYRSHITISFFVSLIQ